MGAGNSFAGLTTLTAGQLVVNGSLASSTFNIDGGSLGGAGTVGDLNVNSAGIVAPGNSIGTLHVAGNYLQNGAYHTEINNAGNSDLIAVAGTATLDAASTLSVLAAPGNYLTGTQYTILTAGGGVIGQFGTVLDDLPFMDVDVLYGSNDIILVLTTNQTQFSSLATTFNQRQVANVLDNYQPSTGGELGLLIDQLELQNTAGVQYGLQSLDAELFGSTATLVIEKTDLYLQTNVNYLRQRSGLSAGSRSYTSFATVNESSAMTGRVAGQLAPPHDIQLASYRQPSRAGSSAAAATATSTHTPVHCSCQTCCGGCNGPLTSGWVQGIGAGGDVNGNGNAVGLNYGIGATAFGVDWQYDDTLIGFGGGYAHLNVDQQQGLGSNQVDSLQCSLYGLQRLDDFYVLGLTGYASDDFESRRNIYLGGINPTALGDYRGDEFFAYLETGCNIPLDCFDLPGGCWNLQPIAGLRYLLLHQQGFTETDAGIANLTVAGDTFDSLRYSLGARLCQTNQTEWGYWAPYVQAGWVHETLDNERLINAGFAGVLEGSFVSQGNVLGRDFGEFGLGTTTNLYRNLDLYLGYDLQVSTRQVAHGGGGGLQFLW